MKNPFINATETFRKNFQETTELTTETFNTVVDSINTQIQLGLDTNRKMVELFNHQLNTLAKTNLDLMHKMSSTANNQIEKATNFVKEEVANATNATKK
ncbi:MAG: hypothetical protein LC115_01500 [Bacteroidia bacterium]|nr:hypothetical protein [Bacteroidia bacterium]